MVVVVVVPQAVGVNAGGAMARARSQRSRVKQWRQQQLDAAPGQRMPHTSRVRQQLRQRRGSADFAAVEPAGGTAARTPPVTPAITMAVKTEVGAAIRVIQ